jgi:hypothetical protein
VVKQMTVERRGILQGAAPLAFVSIRNFGKPAACIEDLTPRKKSPRRLAWFTRAAGFSHQEQGWLSPQRANSTLSVELASTRIVNRYRARHPRQP